MDDLKFRKSILNGNEYMVKYMLQKGANPARIFSDSNNPLIMSAFLGHIPIAKILIETGKVDVNYANKFGNTALLIANMNNHKKMVEYLLTIEGINKDHMNLEGYRIRY
ncbi:unnamed protein product [marine sediment metagenome]|uniref:Uncharacterized protein n=1 Tax=marine sediment metagenome TaxID=412755 RepID=X0UU00_9ZZZZ